jgi:hypothetical protein
LGVGTKINFTVPSHKNGKHRILESHAGQNERHPRKNARHDGEAEMFTSLHNGGHQKNQQRRNETRNKSLESIILDSMKDAQNY